MSALKNSWAIADLLASRRKHNRIGPRGDGLVMDGHRLKIRCAGAMNRPVRVHRRCAALLSLVLAACGATAHVPTAPPPAPPRSTANGLEVTLTWSTPVDLDLYLTDPTWETVYFANNPSRTGARLLRDTRCADIASREHSFVEVAVMPQPLAGRYRVGVDFIDACDAPHRAVSFRITADYGGVRREAVGTIRLEQFQPIVVEFELRHMGSGETLTLVQEGQ